MFSSKSSLQAFKRYILLIQGTKQHSNENKNKKNQQCVSSFFSKQRINKEIRCITNKEKGKPTMNERENDVYDIL